MADLVDVEVLAQLLEAATDLPWRYNPGKEWFTDPDKLYAARLGIPMSGGEEFVGAGPDDGDNATTIGVAATGPANDPRAMADAALIAAAVNALPALLGELRLHQQRLDAIKSLIADAWDLPEVGHCWIEALHRAAIGGTK